MDIGRRLRNRPHLLERVYQVVERVFWRLDPLIARLGYERAERWLRLPEEWSKEAIFDCRMCGQCILHSTGMTCPMTCPKTMRNGPCGGVRANGHCEVIPEMPCIWLEAYERSEKMNVYGEEMMLIQPPVNHRLQGTSAWINMLTGKDSQKPFGWVGLDKVAVVSASGERDAAAAPQGANDGQEG